MHIHAYVLWLLVGDDFIHLKNICEVTFDFLCYDASGYRGLATSGPLPLIYLSDQQGVLERNGGML